MSFKAGDLNQRVAVQVASKTRGTSGEEVQTWQTVATIWAQVQTSGGSEKFYSPQLVAESTHKVKIRPVSGIDPVMRLLWMGRIMDIVHIDYSRTIHGEMYLLCREAVTP